MQLEFWYEFASTYSYLSVMRIERVAADAGISLEYCPFLLGPIFGKQGWNTSPFILYPARGRYMWRDVTRRATRHGLVFRKPSIFPRNGLLAARVALVGLGEGWSPAFTRAVFSAEFTEDRDIAEWAVLREILESLQQNPDRVLARAQAAENKAELRERSETAEARGIFGAPSFFVGDELFWGDDRLEEAVEFASSVGEAV
jgi:2-hydroxychromene-2-carboxylate isomerase